MIGFSSDAVLTICPQDRLWGAAGRKPWVVHLIPNKEKMHLINSLLPLHWNFYWKDTPFSYILAEAISSLRRVRFLEDREGHNVLCRGGGIREATPSVEHFVIAEAKNAGQSCNHISPVPTGIWCCLTFTHTPNPYHSPPTSYPIIWQIPCSALDRSSRKRIVIIITFWGFTKIRNSTKHFTLIILLNFVVDTVVHYPEVPPSGLGYSLPQPLGLVLVTGDSPIIDLGQSELSHQYWVSSPGTALIQWQLKVGVQKPAPAFQRGIAQKGQLSPRDPCRISWVLHVNCTIHATFVLCLIVLPSSLPGVLPQSVL